MVSMRDVANAAGVSKASVSRVMNGLATSPEVTEKVTRVIEQLGYRRNALATALTTRKNSLIGVIIGECFDTNTLAEAFTFQLLERVSELNKPLAVIRSGTQPSFSLLNSLQTLIEQRCEGIVFIAPPNSSCPEHCLFETALREDIPFVIIQGVGAGNTHQHDLEGRQVTISDYDTINHTVNHRCVSFNDSIEQIFSIFTR